MSWKLETKIVPCGYFRNISYFAKKKAVMEMQLLFCFFSGLEIFRLVQVDWIRPCSVAPLFTLASAAFIYLFFKKAVLQVIAKQVNYTIILLKCNHMLYC